MLSRQTSIKRPGQQNAILLISLGISEQCKEQRSWFMSNIGTGSHLHTQLCRLPVAADAEHSGLTPAKAMQRFPLIIASAQHRVQRDYDSVLVMGMVSLHKTRCRQCSDAVMLFSSNHRVRRELAWHNMPTPSDVYDSGI